MDEPTGHDDDFDTAFDEAALSDQPETLPEQPADPQPQAGPDDAPAAKADAPTGDDAGAAPVDWQARYEANEQRMRSWEGRLSAKDREIAELRQAVGQGRQPRVTRADTPPDIDDPELRKLSEEYPDVVPAMWNALNRRLQQTVQPLAEQSQTLSQDQHFARVAAAHPDYADIGASQEFNDWIGQQPEYVQPAIERIRQGGNAREVIALLNDYKQSRQPAADEAAAAARTQKRSEQLKAATAVRSRSGGPPAVEADINDFNAAWKQA